tara:strand:+ start:63 stop:329 length:267 start_codon:yes stop_codon:yes gene_type:complete
MADYKYTKDDFIEMGYIDENNPVNIDKVINEVQSLFENLIDRLTADERSKFEDTITALKSIQSRVYIMGLQLKNIVEDVHILKSSIKE